MKEKKDSYHKDVEKEIERHNNALLNLADQRDIALKHWQGILDGAQKDQQEAEQKYAESLELTGKAIVSATKPQQEHMATLGVQVVSERVVTETAFARPEAKAGWFQAYMLKVANLPADQQALACWRLNEEFMGHLCQPAPLSPAKAPPASPPAKAAGSAAATATAEGGAGANQQEKPLEKAEAMRIVKREQQDDDQEPPSKRFIVEAMQVANPMPAEALEKAKALALQTASVNMQIED